MNEQKHLNRVRVRAILLGLCCSLWVAVLGGRLFYLTVVARDSLQERAELQQQHTLKLDPTRGTIHDRKGRELAMSVEVESIYAVPKAIEPDAVAAAAAELSRCLATEERRIADRLRRETSFAWLLRKAKPGAVACVRELAIPGIGFLPESRRFYPKRRLASHVLGYVGMDNEGMSGVEYALEEQIRGRAGRQLIWTDARKRRAASRVEQRPSPGLPVYLTLDENLQYLTEDELNRAVVESHSKSGIAILMRPRTGEILAMAAHPSFNPNSYGASPNSHWRNRAVTDTYEPGSTFKIITAAAALEEGVTSEEERIDCGRGLLQIGDRIIRDHRVFDFLSFSDVIAHSSNVGMMRIAQRLGKERFESYIRDFGFGQETGVDLPAESRGILRPAAQWGGVTLASIAFGQEIGVTPVQMITAANAIAASGYLMRPRLVLAVGDAAGEREGRLRAEPVRRVVSEETARRVTELLIGVVERGTGGAARIPGYQVAGKTGTAQKAVRGGYSETDYIASFVGFVPAHEPELTALVILDSPHGDHSGARAAKVFARIVERSLYYLGVPPENPHTMSVVARWPETAPVLPTQVEEESFDLVAVAGRAPRPPRVPDIVGYAARDAVARVLASKLIPELTGTGWVLEQDPSPGSELEPGAHCRLVLGPAALVPPERRKVPLAPDVSKGRELRLAESFLLPPTTLQASVPTGGRP